MTMHQGRRASAEAVLPAAADRTTSSPHDRSVVTLGPGSRVSGVTSRGGRVEAMNQTDSFEAERPRLVRIASRVLGDHAEAQDVVQQAWLRLHGTDAEIDSLPAWLTTETTRLCLDRLRSRTPVPRSRSSSETGPVPPGSTSARPGLSSTSP
jgi:hypothetical protein